MTPKEKADQLIKECYDNATDFIDSNNAAKEASIVFALLIIDELVHYLPSIDGMPPNCQNINEYCCEFWNKVKEEIEKL